MLVDEDDGLGLLMHLEGEALIDEVVACVLGGLIGGIEIGELVGGERVEGVEGQVG